MLTEPPISWSPPGAALLYESPLLNSDGETILRLYRSGPCEVLAFTDVADFYLWPDSIGCHPSKAVEMSLVEIRLLGLVAAYWLERRGMPAIHASAVVIDDQAVALLGNNGGGKTSLAGTFMAAGHPLLTDDILALELAGSTSGLEGSPEPVLGRSGYPQMRMWPDLVEHFIGSLEGLERVHPQLEKRRVPVGGKNGFGRFHSKAHPLTVFYLPERRPEGEGDEVLIEPLSQRDAVFELVRHSFLLRLVETLGWQTRRLDLLVRTALSVPVLRLSYPSGLHHLEKVRDAIARDRALSQDLARRRS